MGEDGFGSFAYTIEGCNHHVVAFHARDELFLHCFFVASTGDVATFVAVEQKDGFATGVARYIHFSFHKL